ncbi:hypothetical protein CS060_03235 [Anoxybacillus flavithermus]|uniref:Uncharacterized protein n=1 Tax=Anoxybacillus flavithermus TaxID=33934 RepID=A0A2G5RSJ4_9BACL|nr:MULTISPECIES: hypothetical protein [Anoxybacillus]KFZ42177.1 hypothetical protein JS80_11895 [Anoxybacillus sp. KU2-6(11)]PIC05764.1 hypothetical protein CS060_03235 [Anoxybacillus flavithermus]
MKEYETLFNEYVRELTEAVKEEDERLKRIREINRNKFDTEEELENFIKERFDPICHSGRVIAVFRKYWLECNKLNEANIGYVNPEDFTVDWLSGRHESLYKIVTDMAYYPIGIDKYGNYC